MGSNCFDVTFVSGYRRVPEPPAKIMPFILSILNHFCSIDIVIFFKYSLCELIGFRFNFFNVLITDTKNALQKNIWIIKNLNLAFLGIFFYYNLLTIKIRVFQDCFTFFFGWYSLQFFLFCWMTARKKSLSKRLWLIAFLAFLIYRNYKIPTNNLFSILPNSQSIS